MERGYYGIGVEDVAREAGVSRQAVYLHFKSKADLLVATVQYGDEMLGVTELVRPALEARTPLEALDAGVSAYATMEPQIYDMASFIYAARRSEEAAEVAWQDRMAFRRENIKQVMTRLHRDGVLAAEWTVEEATDFVWSLLSVHTYEYLIIERGWPMERFVGRLRKVLHCILVKERGANG